MWQSQGLRHGVLEVGLVRGGMRGRTGDDLAGDAHDDRVVVHRADHDGVAADRVADADAGKGFASTSENNARCGQEEDAAEGECGVGALLLGMEGWSPVASTRMPRMTWVVCVNAP